MKQPNRLKRTLAAGTILLSSMLGGCANTPTGQRSNISNSPPNTQITNQTINSSGDTTIWFNGTDSDGDVLGYYFKLDNWPEIYTIGNNTTYYNLPTGNHSFSVTAEDNDGERDPTPAFKSFRIENNTQDNISPNTSITSGPTGTIDYDDVSFGWNGSDNQTTLEDLVFSYFLEGTDDNYGPWTSSTQKSYDNLQEGPYTFYVKSKDLAGNVDQSPASRSFTIDIDQPQNNILTYIEEFEIPLGEREGNLEAITVRTNGNLVTVGSGDYSDYNEDIIIREHNPTYPPSFLRYEVDLPGQFIMSESITFDGENYWVANNGLYAHSTILDGNNPENVIFTGAMNNRISDMCYGFYEDQPAMFQVTNINGSDLFIHKTEPQGENDFFGQIRIVEEEELPWDFVTGIYFKGNSLYSISKKKGEPIGAPQGLFRHNLQNFGIEEEWEFQINPQQVKGLAIFGNEIYTCGDNKIKHYRLQN